jgi:2,4-dienoyl-CoA reductase (NADPH2)
MGTLGGPVLVRTRVAPSRVLFGPHPTNLARRREFSDRHVAYYARRATGGCGVIVTETASVHPSDHPYERAPLAADCVAGWAAVRWACRPALVLAGLGHAGAQGSSAYHQQALWAPSRTADVATREMPMEMEQPEIDALVDGFAAAAALAVEADLDGVEIDAGQYSLLRQFLSGLTNHRADGYGRDRALLLREVLGAVRAELGEDRILGLRMSCDELAPWAGVTPSDAAATAATLDVDLLAVVRGSGTATHATRPDLHTEPGFNRDLCASVRAAVEESEGRPDPARIPSTGRDTSAGEGGPSVVLQGSVVDPAFAQAALDDGVCDLVEMTRAQITDPDLVAHVRAGAPGRIRPCTLSNQRTHVRDPRNPIVSDDAEPDAGHETEVPVAEPVPPRDVLVVGGGPAGLEAARELALAGHRVRLAEQSPVLGGALRLAAAVAGRSRMGVLIPWWERELARLGVTVETGVRVEPADLDAAARDGVAVLLATGSRSAPRPCPSAVPVLTAAELAGGAALPVGPVVVHDPVGDGTGVGVAEQLAALGRDTTLVTPDQVAGTQLSLTGDLAPANARLDRAGVRRALLSHLTRVVAPTAESRHDPARGSTRSDARVDPDRRSGQYGVAVLEHAWTGEQREIPCAVVVDCGHRLPDDALWLARPHLVRAGDCVAPRTLHEAVLEGRRGAAAIARGV